jgi:molybdopterin-binding protein
MKLSARNVLKGKVKQVTLGPVSAEVIVQLPGRQEIVSVITTTSAQSLGLTKGKEVFVVIKASNIMLATE